MMNLCRYLWQISSHSRETRRCTVCLRCASARVPAGKKSRVSEGGKVTTTGHEQSGNRCKHSSSCAKLSLEGGGAHLEVVRGGVELPAALVLAAERLLTDVGGPHLPVVLILQHNLRDTQIRLHR